MLAAAVAGPALIADAGLTNADLLDGAWDDLVVRYRKLGAAAFNDASEVVSHLIGEWRTGYPAAMRATFEQHLDESTEMFVSGMNELATQKFLDPKGLDEVGDLVPNGFVRHVLARAGGQTDIQSTGFAFVTVTGDGRGLPGLTTGPVVTSALTDHGGSIEGYRWVYGPAQRSEPFRPHMRLAGVVFKNFDDPQLANTHGWPGFGFYIPGDHAGCRCDAEPIMVDPVFAKVIGLQPDVVLSPRELARAAKDKAFVDAAEKFDVSPDEVRGAMPLVREVRQAIANDAAETQARAWAQLQRGGGDNVFLPRPPKMGSAARSAGDWDWLSGLSKEERDRLARAWYTDSAQASSVDEIASELVKGLGSANETDTNGIIEQVWLRSNREIEAAGALRRGRLPVDKHYSGSNQVDANVLAPTVHAEGIDVYKVIGVSDEDAAAYLAGLEREQVANEAYSALGASRTNPDVAPWRMSFQSWEAEVREVEYVMRELPDEVTPALLARYDELVPSTLDAPGLDYESLYSVIVQTANLAGVDVAPWARIPWA